MPIQEPFRRFRRFKVLSADDQSMVSQSRLNQGNFRCYVCSKIAIGISPTHFHLARRRSVFLCFDCCMKNKTLRQHYNEAHTDVISTDVLVAPISTFTVQSATETTRRADLERRTRPTASTNIPVEATYNCRSGQLYTCNRCGNFYGSCVEGESNLIRHNCSRSGRNIFMLGKLYPTPGSPEKSQVIHRYKAYYKMRSTSLKRKVPSTAQKLAAMPSNYLKDKHSLTSGRSIDKVFRKKRKLLNDCDRMNDNIPVGIRTLCRLSNMLKTQENNTHPSRSRKNTLVGRILPCPNEPKTTQILASGGPRSQSRKRSRVDERLGIVASQKKRKLLNEEFEKSRSISNLLYLSTGSMTLRSENSQTLMPSRIVSSAQNLQNYSEITDTNLNPIRNEMPDIRFCALKDSQNRVISNSFNSKNNAYFYLESESDTELCNSDSESNESDSESNESDSESSESDTDSSSADFNYRLSDADSSDSEADSSGSETDSSDSETDSSDSETDSSDSETDSTVSETDSTVSETDSTVSETDSTVSETDSSVSESDMESLYDVPGASDVESEVF
eukprot:869178_1